MTAKYTRDDVEVVSTDVRANPHSGDWWHIRINGDNYIVSAVDLTNPIVASIDRMFGVVRSAETMAFPANERGEVTDWLELAMVPFKDHEACIAELLLSLETS